MASKKSMTTTNKKTQKRSASSKATAYDDCTPTVHHDFRSIDLDTAQKPTSDDVLIAYVQEISQIKRNKGDTMNYCTFKLQTSATTHKEALLYSLAKRPLLIESESTRTPVKLKNFTFTQDKSKIVINDMTNISIPRQSEYSFQFADIRSPENTATVFDVYNNYSEWDTVTVRGKILSVNQPRTVGSPKKRLKVMEATIADQTGAIPIDLWESNIDQVKVGSVYNLDQVQVRVWSSRKKLSTTIKSKIVPFEEPALANIEKPTSHDTQDETTTIVNKISTIQKVDKFLKCVHCNKKIIQASAEVIVCNQCGHTMREDDCTKGLVAKVVIPVDDDKITVMINDEILNTLFEGNVILMEEQVLFGKLLSLQNIAVTYNPDNSRVSKVLKQQ